MDYTEIKVQALENRHYGYARMWKIHKYRKKVVIIGASTGTDAHTVGMNAIMNMKGYAGHYGLERYRGIKLII